MALVKGRHCSESCMELLALEMVHHYQSQTRLPAAAAIEAIGARLSQNHPRSPHDLARGKRRCEQ